MISGNRELKRNALTGCFFLACMMVVSNAPAQTLRFSNHREVKIPEYAVLRIGPFYSSVTFSQSAGYRYTSGEGEGVDYLFSNRRGVFLKDGSDFPLVSTLDMQNYIIISPTTDLDISLRASYAHYPLKTQEDEFLFDVVEEGIAGNFSTEFSLIPYVKGTAFDNVKYRTDYIDARGLVDRYGGQAYEHFQNDLGVNLDWLMARDQNMGLSISRSDVLPSDDEFKAQERVSYNEALSYQWMINPMVMAGASAVFAQNSYTAVTNRPDSSFQTFSVFSTVRLTEQTVGSVSLGYARASVSEYGGLVGEAFDNSGMIGAVSVKTELSRELEHELSYARSMTAGFMSAYEMNDKYSYHLNWTQEGALSASLFSEYLKSVPSEIMGEYTDWVSGVRMSLPVTSLVAIDLSTTYSIRENNGGGSNGEESSIELTSDYNTWSSRIGTSVPLMRRDRSGVVFAAYAEHIERSGDSDVLNYSRNIIAATLTYTHMF